MLTSVEIVIAALGGKISAVAKALGVTLQRVCNWRSRGRIPGAFIVKAARVAGVSAEMLLQAQRPRR